MVRIVSGMDEMADRNIGAYLKGHEGGMALSARAKAAADRQGELDAAAMREFQKEATKLQSEEAEALRRHREGERDAQAEAAYAQAIERAKADPKTAAKMKRAFLAKGGLTRLAERGVSADSIQRIYSNIKAAEDDIAKAEQYQMAEKEIERAVADQVPGAEGFQMELKTGGDPSALVGKSYKGRTDRSTKAVYSEKNAEDYQRAISVVQAAPPGRPRDMAMVHLKEYEMSPSLQEQEGSGAELFSEVSKALIGSQSEYSKMGERRAASPAPGLPGMTIGQRNEELEMGRGMEVPEFVPSGPQAHATTRRFEGLIRDAATQAGGDTKKLLQLLSDQGIPVTDDLLRQVHAVISK